MLSETLRELSTVLGSSLDLNSVLDGILVGLERVVPYTSGADPAARQRRRSLPDRDGARRSCRVRIAEAWDETIPADEMPATERLIDLLHRLNATPDPAEAARTTKSWCR